jgi:Tetratricopeptide repeat
VFCAPTQLPPQHTLRANYDLASLYLRQKRWDEFERLCRDTLSRQRRVLGDAHLDTLSSLNNLQSFYFIRRRYAEAEPLAIEVFEARQRTLGGDHPSTLRALHNLASIFDASGRQVDRRYRVFINDGQRRVALQ